MPIHARVITLLVRMPGGGQLLVRMRRRPSCGPARCKRGGAAAGRCSTQVAAASAHALRANSRKCAESFIKNKFCADYGSYYIATRYILPVNNKFSRRRAGNGCTVVDWALGLAL